MFLVYQMTRLFSLSVLSWVILNSIIAGASFAQDKLVIAIQPTLSSDEMLSKAKPLEKFISDGLGGKTQVQIYVPSSYAAVVESLRFGHAHVAFMSAWPAQLAVQLGGAEVLLAEVRRVIHGDKSVDATSYYSYWVVRPNSPHKNLESLKGKSVCFPSPISTSGYVAPMGRLAELNLLKSAKGAEADPKTFFKDVLFGGGYAQCYQALKQGQVEATIIAGDVPEKLYKEVLADTRVIEQQGPIPSHAVVISKELKEPLRQKTLETITKLGAPEHQNLMRSFISSIFVGFKPTTAAEHLSSLNNYLKLVGLKYTERL
jgi:phosphonate transport system substrate-binding protein